MVRDKANFSDSMKMLIAIDIACCFTLHNDGSYSVSVYVVDHSCEIETMPPRKSSSSSKKDEIQVSKSPAEFFAENQSIAGFDNPVS